jgi:hypothetical protein
MLNREWLTTDYYADLGVTRAATETDITEQYRSLAWELHPDRHPGDPAAEARFKRIARAYTVLGNAEQRVAYDAQRDAVFDRGFAPSPGTTRPTMTPARPKRLFSLNPRVGYVLGTVLFGLGVAATIWIITVTRHDAQVRNQGVAVGATVTEVRPTAQVRFTTSGGEVVTATAPVLRNRRNGGYVLGEVVPIRYLRASPREIVVDESQTARNVTMWIIAIKLLACGVILIGLSLWQARQRRLEVIVARSPSPAEQRRALHIPANRT